MKDSLEFINGGETYLVTGSTGLIGRSLVRLIMEWNLNHPEKEPCRLLLGMRDPKKAKSLFGELNPSIYRVFSYENHEKLPPKPGVDWIICAGAETRKPFFRTNPVDVWSTNVSGIFHCLSYAKEHSVKGILFFSSVMAKAEPDIRNIETCYAESKRTGELLCSTYAMQYRVPAKIIRFFHVYGVGERLENGTFWGDFMSDVLHGRDIVMKSSGASERNMCYSEDAARAALYVLHKGIPGEIYEAGSELNNHTIAEAAEWIRQCGEELGKEIHIILKEDIDGATDLVPIQKPDLTMLRELGWKEENTDFKENLKMIMKQFL